MVNDVLIRELAQSRINDLYRTADASRQARLARGRGGHRTAYLPQLFASLRRGATRVARGTTAPIPRQRISVETRSGRHRVDARPQSRTSTQCC